MKPILFKIGSFPVRSWGVMVAIGFLTGLYFVVKRANQRGIPSEKVYDLAFYLLLAGLIFGRLIFILFDFSYYLKNPVEIIMIQNGGMSVHGALIGGFIAAYVYCKRKNLSILELGDIVAPSVFIGQAIGRIGCFLNGDDYGIVTNNFLGVRFPGITGARYPTQLFESFFDLLALGLIFVISKRFKKPGQIFFISVILYSLIRFAIEFLRDDMVYIVKSLTWGQTASLAMILVASVALVITKKKTDENTNST